jgi:hypothetical protein
MNDRIIVVRSRYELCVERWKRKSAVIILSRALWGAIGCDIGPTSYLRKRERGRVIFEKEKGIASKPNPELPCEVLRSSRLVLTRRRRHRYAQDRFLSVRDS